MQHQWAERLSERGESLSPPYTTSEQTFISNEPLFHSYEQRRTSMSVTTMVTGRLSPFVPGGLRRIVMSCSPASLFLLRSAASARHISIPNALLYRRILKALGVMQCSNTTQGSNVH